MFELYQPLYNLLLVANCGAIKKIFKKKSLDFLIDTFFVFFQFMISRLREANLKSFSPLLKWGKLHHFDVVLSALLNNLRHKQWFYANFELMECLHPFVAK